MLIQLKLPRHSDNQQNLKIKQMLYDYDKCYEEKVLGRNTIYTRVVRENFTGK